MNFKKFMVAYQIGRNKSVDFFDTLEEAHEYIAMQKDIAKDKYILHGVYEENPRYITRFILR